MVMFAQPKLAKTSMASGYADRRFRKQPLQSIAS
jgi:hypothetical protein